MASIFGTTECGIEVAVAGALAAREPRHGGKMVAYARFQLSGRLLSSEKGYFMEVCRPFSEDGCVYLSRVGAPGERCFALGLFDYLGDEQPRTRDELAAELDKTTELDRQAYRQGMAELVRQNLVKEAIAAFNAEFDSLFEEITSDYPDAPVIECAPSQSACARCDVEIDPMRHQVAVLDGGIHCKLCTLKVAYAE